MTTILKHWPLVMFVIGVLVWGLRLESKVDNLIINQEQNKIERAELKTSIKQLTNSNIRLEKTLVRLETTIDERGKKL